MRIAWLPKDARRERTATSILATRLDAMRGGSFAALPRLAWPRQGNKSVAECNLPPLIRGSGEAAAMKLSINVGWLGVASTVVLGILACVECYMQESSRMSAFERSPAVVAAAPESSL